MGRTSLSIDRAVFDEFAAQVARRNMTLFAFSNECLSAMAKITAEGGDPSELYNVWKVLSILKEAEVVTLPSGFFEELVRELYILDREKLLRHFHELGKSVVGLLNIFADDLPALAELARSFGFIVPIKHFAISNGNNGNMRIDVVGAGKSLEATECSCEFLKPIVEAYGYSVVKGDLHPGSIRLWCQERSQPRKEVFVAVNSPGR